MKARTLPDLNEVTRLRVAVMRLSRRLRQQGGGGITPSQLAVIGSLERHGPLTLGELATTEGVSAPAMTRIVRVLEESQLVTRSVPADDRRTVVIERTAKARRLAESIRSQRNAWLAERLAELSPREADELTRGVAVLERILERGA